MNETPAPEMAKLEAQTDKGDQARGNRTSNPRCRINDMFSFLVAGEGGILRQAKEVVFGHQERHPTQRPTNANLPDDTKQFSFESREGLSGPATWAAQKVGVVNGNNHEAPKAPVDKFPGLDQFGGENMERDEVGLKEHENKINVARLTRWPDGLDQFGGEDEERDKPPSQ